MNPRKRTEAVLHKSNADLLTTAFNFFSFKTITILLKKPNRHIEKKKEKLLKIIFFSYKFSVLFNIVEKGNLFTNKMIIPEEQILVCRYLAH